MKKIHRKANASVEYHLSLHHLNRKDSSLLAVAVIDNAGFDIRSYP
jgi:hypothetical protein